MAKCRKCGADIGLLSMASDGLCKQCRAQEFEEMKAEIVDREEASAQQAEAAAQAAERIILTTETAHNLPVAERLDIVTAEVVIGMHLFKDIASAFRDTFGGRSKTMQDGLREARKTALSELRMEAQALGADAVVGIDLDYSEISGGGKSMLFLVASGTAVSLRKN